MRKMLFLATAVEAEEKEKSNIFLCCSIHTNLFLEKNLMNKL